MSDKIGYAVVGLGIGRAHADGVLSSERGKLVAVCDIDEKRLGKFKSEHPDVEAYPDFTEMLRDDRIQVVSICVPSGLHAKLAVQAMEAGKHVLVEKPIDITVEAAAKIEEARVRTGLKAGVIHQNRFNACMEPLREALDAGRLGRLILGTFAVKWFRDQKYYDAGGWRGTWEMDGGGSLMNQAVHTVDIMQWLMGEVDTVTSYAGIHNHHIDTEDLTASIIKFKSGAVATFVSTTCAYPGISTDIQLYGTGGSVEIDGDKLKLWKLTDADELEEEEMLDMYGGGGGSPSADPGKVRGHAFQVHDMIDAVYYDRDPVIPPREAIKSVAIVNAVYESARTGKPVAPKYI
jgi:UDP-N-acetyl-2-amino-2-deoxyglucuronate dehydrogenase